MKIGERNYQGIWYDESDPYSVSIIDQRKLPFFFETCRLGSVDEIYEAISGMTVRGAPLIGATAAFGMYLATLEITPSTVIRDHLSNAARYLASSRPTAVNLKWAIDRVLSALDEHLSPDLLREKALEEALSICSEEVERCRMIGENGLRLIAEISEKKKGTPVNILTHCNAGWLACVDYGTATAPIYLAHDRGIPVHVWVDETRPRNQGARLTAWELGQHGVPHTVIPDNTGGHLMQQKLVDIVIVGSDRTTRRGDVANKIGTYLKALAARDNKIPFYVALPTSSIDMTLLDGPAEIPVEMREEEEVTFVEGMAEGKIVSVRIAPETSHAANYGFDITPARLITGLITERGVCRADQEDIIELFSDKSG
jgi:methylthioribose-1-phosphate isomerase